MKAIPATRELRAAASTAGVRALVGWGVRACVVVADQACLAGAHLAVNVLLARWLAPSEYGLFAVSHSVFLLVAAAYDATVTEPMAVLGSGKYRSVGRNYFSLLLRWHLALTGVPALAMLGGAAVAALLGFTGSAEALLALGVASPLLLLASLTRREFYRQMRPLGAALGSVVYLVALSAGVVWLQRRGALSIVSVFLAMAAGAALTATLQLAVLRPSWHQARRDVRLSGALQDHRRYGSWALGTTLAAWVPLNVYYVTLPAWSGLEAAAVLKAVLNLAQPVLHAQIAFSLLLVPLLVRLRDAQDVRRIRNTMAAVVGVYLVGAAGYSVVLWIYGADLVRLVYGGRYPSVAALPLALLVVLLFVASLRSVVGGVLRAWERPQDLFWSQVVAAGVTLAIGVPLAAMHGLSGALAGLVCAFFASLLTASRSVHRRGLVAMSTTPSPLRECAAPSV